MEHLPSDAHPELVLSVLADSSLFHGLEPAQLIQAASHGELYTYPGGEALALQGETSDGFFVLVKGEAAVMLDQDTGEQPLEIARLTPPDTVGEMGVLLGSPRSASVVAVGEVVALHFSSERFHQMLLRLPYFGLVMSRTLARRLHEATRRMPLPELGDPASRPPPEVLALLPVEFQVRHRVVPFSVNGGKLTLGFVDDAPPTVLAAARQHLPGMEVHTVRIGRALFDEVMQRHGAVRGWPPGATGGEPPTSTNPIDGLLRRMVAEGASDLHLSAGHAPRWRVDGEIRALDDLPRLGPRTVSDLLEPLMAERHKEQFAKTSDSDFAYAVAGLARFRVNIFRDVRGIGAVLRQIPDKVHTVEQLGLPPAVANFCTLPKGLVLVTGPTGSGKSTSLAAMVDYINRTRADHIITLEDPIEFVHQSQRSLINQREVGAHTESFSRALRAALREDPDVVLVGEMRDLETVALALETAATGHLVFGTLHTATAMGTIDRIIGMFPTDQQNQIRSTLAEVLRGVVAQTLLRRNGGGRVAAFEVMVANYAIASLIREGKTFQIPNVMTSAKALGNVQLNESLAVLVQRGVVTFDEAVSRSLDKPDLARRLGRPAPS